MKPEVKGDNLAGGLPRQQAWPYSAGWGAFPAGGLGVVVIVLLILVIMGRI